jgi:hypothetical protein
MTMQLVCLHDESPLLLAMSLDGGRENQRYIVGIERGM